jgi:histidine ammonia-lyase
MEAEPKELYLDGESLTVEDLMSIHADSKIHIKDSAWERVRASRRIVDKIISEGKVAYGINTGFGNFAEVVIPNDKLKELQENLIRSHAAGVGPALSVDRAKRLLALRINVLAKGSSRSVNSLRFTVLKFCATTFPLWASGGSRLFSRYSELVNIFSILYINSFRHR